MRATTITGMALVALLAACHAKQPAAPTAQPNQNISAPAARTAATPSAVLDERAPLPEPQGPIDPKSAEAAGQELRTYGALLEERKFDQAYALWGGAGEASGMTRAQFAASFAAYRDIHAGVGKPGEAEGAAGSSYVEVPLRLYGTLASGGKFDMSGPMAMRRVNDVDGSTAEQRRWNIASSGLKPKP